MALSSKIKGQASQKLVCKVAFVFENTQNISVP